MMFSAADLVAVAVYALLLLGIGLTAGRHIQSVDSYTVADRSLRMQALITATLTSSIGVSVLFGNFEATLRYGIWAFLVVLGWHIGWWILCALAGQLRRSEAVSLADFFGECWSLRTRILASGIISIQLVTTIAPQVNGISIVLGAIGISSLKAGMLLGGAAVVIYTLLGGMYTLSVAGKYQILVLFGVIFVFSLCQWQLCRLPAGGPAFPRDFTCK